MFFFHESATLKLVDSGELSAYEGRVEVGAVSGVGAVKLAENGALSFDSEIAQGTVRLENGAFIDVAFTNGGDIGITSQKINIEQSRLSAGIFEGFGSASSQAGNITLNATDLVHIIDSEIANNIPFNATGRAGNIIIAANRLEVLDGSSLSTLTNGSGDAGNILITVDDDVLLAGRGPYGEFTTISSEVDAVGEGNGGNVEIITSVLESRDEAQLLSGTAGSGNAGNVVINASERVTFSTEIGDSLSIISTVSTTGNGSGGDISITTPVLELLDGVLIFSDTVGNGNAGNITLTATERITVRGAITDISGEQGGISSSVGFSGVGEGGSIDITTPVLEIQNSAQIGVDAGGNGNAGDIEIEASDRISINNASIRAASVFNEPSFIRRGTAGDISITTSTLEMENGAQIQVDTELDDGAGSIDIEARERVSLSGASISAISISDSEGGDIAIDTPVLSLTNRSALSAETNSTDGGNVFLSLEDLLVLTDNSNISTQAGTEQAGGNGGDIDISARFIAAAPDENNDITADAFDGNGGNVDITATGGIFGITPQPERTAQSDITASSENGVSGDITVQSPYIDPSQSLAALPTDFVAPEVARSCRETLAQGSEFIVSGRGGLPQNPLDSAYTTLWQDILPIEGEGQADSRESIESLPMANSHTLVHTKPFIEMQGWIKNESGQIMLVAADPHRAELGPLAGC